MTPKEKAKELVERFIKTERMCDCYCEHSPNDCDCVAKQTELESAKQCALICVDEIRKSLLIIEGMDGYDFEITGLNAEGSIKDIFWQKVKQEIEKL